MSLGPATRKTPLCFFELCRVAADFDIVARIDGDRIDVHAVVATGFYSPRTKSDIDGVFVIIQGSGSIADMYLQVHLLISDDVEGRSATVFAARSEICEVDGWWRVDSFLASRVLQIVLWDTIGANLACDSQDDSRYAIPPGAEFQHAQQQPTRPMRNLFRVACDCSETHSCIACNSTRSRVAEAVMESRRRLIATRIIQKFARRLAVKRNATRRRTLKRLFRQMDGMSLVHA